MYVVDRGAILNWKIALLGEGYGAFCYIDVLMCFIEVCVCVGGFVLFLLFEVCVFFEGWFGCVFCLTLVFACFGVVFRVGLFFCAFCCCLGFFGVFCVCLLLGFFGGLWVF